MKKYAECYLLSALLLAYTASKAYHMGMTHDECSTFFNFVLPHRGLTEMLTGAFFWQNANNHLLNTLLMQGTMSIFGEAEWALRLPNWLAHMVYLGASGALVSALVAHRGWRLAGFALLNVNPFLLDFFALARGYGLSVGFIMAALWFLYRFSEQPTARNTALLFGSATLAVWSNFTALDFMAALWVLFAVLWWFSPPSKQKLSILLVGAAFSAVCAAVIVQPIRFINKQGEFLYGQKDLGMTFRELFGDWMYGGQPFGPMSDFVCCYAFTVVLGSWFLWLLWRMWRGQSYSKFGLAAVSLVWLITLVMLGRHFLLGADYLRHRTALQLMPILALPFILAINDWCSRQNRAAWLSAVIVIVGLGLLIYDKGSIKSCREWYYDMDTPDMMNHLASSLHSKSAKLGVHQLFFPSVMYYRRKLGLETQITLDQTNNPPDNLGKFDYYFVESAQANFSGVNRVYQTIQTYNFGNQLMKRQQRKERE